MKLLVTAFLLLLSLPATLCAQEWVQRADVPVTTGTDGPIGFSIDEKVYLGGGVGNKRFYEYDPATMKWTRKADIPGVTTERAFGSGFAMNNKGYVGFGYDGSQQTLKDIWEYDPATDKWTRKGDFPGEARDGATVFALNSNARVYVGGGSDNTILFKDFWEYNPENDTWKQLGDLPTGPVIFQSSFVVESAAYIIGGDVGTSETQEVFRYNPEHDTWDPRASFPGKARQAAAAFTYGAVGFIGGGHSKFEEIFSDYYAYTPYANTWAQIDGPVSTGRAWATGITGYDRAYVGTGFDFQNFHNDWWEFGTPSADVSRKESDEQQLLTGFYPNPASQQVSLNLTDVSEISIFDQLGRMVESTKATSGASSIDVRHLPQGVYHVRLRSGEREQTEVLHITR